MHILFTTTCKGLKDTVHTNAITTTQVQRREEIELMHDNTVRQSLKKMQPFKLPVCVQSKVSTLDANQKIPGSKYELRDWLTTCTYLTQQMYQHSQKLAMLICRWQIIHRVASNQYCADRDEWWNIMWYSCTAEPNFNIICHLRLLKNPNCLLVLAFIIAVLCLKQFPSKTRQMISSQCFLTTSNGNFMGCD